jgi:hypothetical protein
MESHCYCAESIALSGVVSQIVLQPASKHGQEKPAKKTGGDSC